MKIAVVYASRSGNTGRVAEAIADALRPAGSVRLMAAEIANLDGDTDLLIVGGPTEGHSMTPPVRQFVERLGRVPGVSAAAFDTRVSWPTWLSGSAAKQIAKALEEAGANLVAPPESFYVTTEPKLHEGELERAARWALTLVAAERMAMSGRPSV